MKLLQKINTIKQLDIPDGQYFFERSSPGFEPHLFFKVKIEGDELEYTKIKTLKHSYKYMFKKYDTRIIPDKFLNALRIKEEKFNNIIIKL